MTIVSEQPVTMVTVDAPHRFVETDAVRSLVERAESYMSAGFAVHFRGVSGTGKTTLGLHLAWRIGRPVIIIHGDEEYTTSHLVGGQHGYHLRKTTDNFIRTVRRYEEDLTNKWIDDRLTIACKQGYTLLYDEFNRSRPEANNVLLSVLQEGVLTMPAGTHYGDHYVRIDPNFRAIFTSNPEEYAGVHPTQDALRERMITLDVDHFDRETEVLVTGRHAPGLSPHVCAWIVDVVVAAREFEGFPVRPTVRSCVKIGRIFSALGINRISAQASVTNVFADVLASGASRSGNPAEIKHLKSAIIQLVQRLTKGA